MGEISFRTTRDYLYVYLSPTDSCLHLSGVSLAEFIKAAKPAHLVIPAGDGSVGLHHDQTNFTYVPVAQNEDVLKETARGVGNFCCFDTEGYDRLDTFSEEDVAAVLFLCHTGRPLRSPFPPSLGNTFFYIGHDDGWYTKLYCQAPFPLYQALGLVVEAKIKRLLRRNVAGLGHVCAEVMQAQAGSGLFLDLTEHRHSEESRFVWWVIPGNKAPYADGTSTNADDLLNHADQFKQMSQTATLSRSNGHWLVRQPGEHQQTVG